MNTQILYPEQVTALRIGNEAKVTITARGHEEGFRNIRIEKSMAQIFPPIFMVVGEPTEKQVAYHAGIVAGWEAAQELVKPGISYTQLSEAVGEIVRKAGITTYRNPIVHGVGLEHTDDPKPYGVMPQTKPDQVLQEGMVINIDFPHTEIGWGSVHMEDTVVITKDGFERLSKSDLSILVQD